MRKGKAICYSCPEDSSERAALEGNRDRAGKVLLPMSHFAIDALLRKSLQMEIRRIQKETDITAIFVTHDQNEANGNVGGDPSSMMAESNSLRYSRYRCCPSCHKICSIFIGSYNLLSSEDFKKWTGAVKRQKQLPARKALWLSLKDWMDDAKHFSVENRGRNPAGKCVSLWNRLRGW